MDDDLARATERLRQARAAAPASALPALAPGAPRPPLAPGTFQADDRVFDTVSGEDGVVVTTTDAERPLFAVVQVQLLSGAIVRRKPGELVARPARPRLVK